MERERLWSAMSQAFEERIENAVRNQLVAEYIVHDALKVWWLLRQPVREAVYEAVHHAVLLHILLEFIHV